VNKKTPGLEMHGLVLLSAFLLVALSLNACGQGSQQQAVPPSPAGQGKVQSSNSIIALNTEEVGTTNDTSRLSQTLTRIFKDRTDHRMLKPGTSEIEKTVYVKAERSIKIGEIIKVINVIKDAGTSSALLPIEIGEDQAENVRPNPLTLLVTIGKPESEAKIISGGIMLIPGPQIERSEKNTVPKEQMVVEMQKDGEYLIDGQPIGKKALENELKSRLKEQPLKRINLLIASDSEINYGSLAEVAYAAFGAGATELYTITVAP
jgi:biopolymer transport protein ExbD